MGMAEAKALSHCYLLSIRLPRLGLLPCCEAAPSTRQAAAVGSQHPAALRSTDLCLLLWQQVISALLT